MTALLCTCSKYTYGFFLTTTMCLVWFLLCLWINDLFISGWISVSVSEFHTVEVQPGGEVTLLCSNFSSLLSHIFWFRMDSRPNISCISSMLSADNNASFYGGFQNGRFNMTSNTTTLFLEIKHVDLSDSALYFCGINSKGKPVIVHATYLKVQGKTVICLLFGKKQSQYGLISTDKR